MSCTAVNSVEIIRSEYYPTRNCHSPEILILFGEQLLEVRPKESADEAPGHITRADEVPIVTSNTEFPLRPWRNRAKKERKLYSQTCAF